MALIITAPETVYSLEHVNSKIQMFLAGGVTGCRNWQDEMIEALRSFDRLVVYNPRRPNWDMENKSMEEEQIVWEASKLRISSLVTFFFPAESVCPITLFELGHYYNKPQVIIGMDPNYQRRRDIEIQMKIYASHIPIVYSLEDLISETKEFLWSML